MAQKTLGVVMDPIGSIKPYKDTTLALMLAAQKRGWALRYFEMPDLWLRDGVHGLVLMGTVGEGNSLSAAEKRRVLEGAVDASEPRSGRFAVEERRHGLRATHVGQRAEPRRIGVRMENDIGIQHGEQAGEIAVARGGEEGGDHALAPLVIGGRRIRQALHAAAGAARELAGGDGRALDNATDLREGHVEHVVQHEGEALGRRQPLQHDEEREADGIGKRRLFIHPGGRIGVLRLARLAVDRVFAAAQARAQHVEADAADHGGEPTGGIVDAVPARALQPQPGLLHRILGLGVRAQHAIGHGMKPSPLGLETVGPQKFFVHRSHSLDC